MAKAKAVVYYQSVEINQYTYYDTSNVTVDKTLDWKNIRNDTEYQTVNAFQKYLDTYNKKFESENNDAIYFSGETCVKTKFLHTSNMGKVSTFVGTEIPVTKSEDSWSTFTKVLTSYLLSFKGAATLEFSRLNSNIYKNIFPEVVSDIGYINDMINNVPTTMQDVIQGNHGFQLYDVLYLDDNGKYQRALAEESEKATVVGMVTKISSNNVFTLMTTGRFFYTHMSHEDTTVLYLSDKEPGKLVHYTEISNTVYVPVAVYTDDSIIINIQQGSVGDTLAPYGEEEMEFELYSISELNDVVNQIVSGVL